MSRSYGYVRVSTKQQKVDRQVAAMEKIGLEKKSIIIDKISGVSFERPRYIRMIKKLKAGDILFIKSIDRLGRDYNEIIEQWHFLVKEKKIDIVVLDFPLLDTRTNSNGITGKFLSDMVLQILSYVAQIEKENIYQRQMEGIREAKKKGVRLGRPIMKLPGNFKEIYDLWERGDISLRSAAKMLGISHPTFKKWTKKIKGKE